MKAVEVDGQFVTSVVCQVNVCLKSNKYYWVKNCRESHVSSSGTYSEIDNNIALEGEGNSRILERVSGGKYGADLKFRYQNQVIYLVKE